MFSQPLKIISHFCVCGSCMFALAAAHVGSALREDFSHILNALKFVYKCCCTHLLIAACFPIHHLSRHANFSRNRPSWGIKSHNKTQCVHADKVDIACAIFLLYASCSSLLQMKPPFHCSLLLSSRSLQFPLIILLLLPAVISALPVSLAFGCDVWSWGERSWGPGVLELASTGPAAPLPLSLLLLNWHDESTFCSIVLYMN